MRSKFFPGQSSFSTSGTRYKLSVYNINVDSSARPERGSKPSRDHSDGCLASTRMKCLVVYYSVYGNTKTVAESIAGRIRSEGHSAEVRSPGMPRRMRKGSRTTSYRPSVGEW
jgi:hypothetical protein